MNVENAKKHLVRQSMQLTMRKHVNSVCVQYATRNCLVKVALLKHMNIHQEKFKCETCNKVFGSKYDLTRHGKVHSKVKEFKCQTCNAKFTTQSNRNRHGKKCV